MFSGGKNHRTTEDNRGLTLVELLVAVVIFSIAIVPMLYAFVYSTGYNFKAQQTLQSTGIAQAIIEKAKSPGSTITSMDSSILGGTLLDTGVFAFGTATKDGATGVYRIENVSAKNLGTEDSVSRRVYDVEIEMSPILSHTTSVIRSMSDDTCNFTDNNSAFTTSALLNEDRHAAELLEDLVKTYAFDDSHTTVKTGGTTVPQTSWPVAHPGQLLVNEGIDIDNLIIRRVFKLNCTSSGVTLKVEYYCGGFYSESGLGTRTLGSTFKASKDVTIGGTTYTISCNGGINSPSTTYSIITSSNFVPGSGDKPFYTAEQPSVGPYTLYSGATDALFFYYYPGYECTTSGNVVNFYDTFVINSSVAKNDISNSDGNFDMYFYKQLNNSITDTAEFNRGEWNYAPYFKINNTGAEMTVNFYNNLLNDVRTSDCYVSADGSGILSSHSGSYANKLQADGTSSLLSFTGNVVNRTRKPVASPVGIDWDNSNLTPYKTVVTSYKIIVRVYKDDESTPIETMSGEVLNW